MFQIYSKKTLLMRQLVAGLVTAMIVLSSLGPVAYAQEATTTPEVTDIPGCLDPEATNFNPDATIDDGTCDYPTPPAQTATSTPSGDGADGQDGPDGTTASSTDEGTATSTNDGADSGDGQDATQTATSTSDGSNTPDGTDQGGTATSTADGTATTTDDGTGTDGTEGGSGTDGQNAEPEAEDVPIPVLSEIEIGEDTTPDDGEGITGEVRRTGTNVSIRTGNATAQGEVSNDVNSNLVRSEVEDAAPSDLDSYTFNATGTNDAIVSTDGVAFALTGDNVARSRNADLASGGIAEVTTGDAVAAINVANIVNTNVVNSDGFLYLKNQVIEPGMSLDLSGFFFPDPAQTKALAQDCTLLSCRAEDVTYNLSQNNMATVTNDVIIDAITGRNDVEGAVSHTLTGDARAAANVMNVVNTNIVDSNYRLLTYNALGDLEGDLILPTQELFHDFFARPNGISQLTALEGPESANINIASANDALVNNNVNTYAESGLNTDLTGSSLSGIETGRSEAESNILNKINENIYGGDSLFVQIRVHGDWSGDVHGLPEGLAWSWGYDANGIVIYIFNEDSEIATSPVLPYDMDTYQANVIDHNRVLIDNNINIDAITGENKMKGTVGMIETGDAFASANVMNIANANIIGANWTYAVINIYGNFDGDIAFSATDVSVSGSVSSPDSPIKPGSQLNYTYVVKNNSPKTATGVTLYQTLQNAYASGTNNQQQVTVGTLAPGQSKQINVTAQPRTDLASGTFSVIAAATVDGLESDSDTTNNHNVLITTVVDSQAGGGSGTTTNTETGSSNTGNGEQLATGSTGGSSGGGGGGGGGGGSHKKKSVDREKEVVIDPLSAPHLVIEKYADLDANEVVLAGEAVDYTIKLTNKGGEAYDAVVYDVLKNEIGSVLSEQSWELGTILAGEVIKLTYTTEYDFKTPSGRYTNTASVEGYRHKDSKANGEKPLSIDKAVHEVQVQGVPLAVGNVSVLAVFPGVGGEVNALVSWETSKLAQSQIFYGEKMPWDNFNEKLTNYGYAMQSFKFSTPKERHLMIIKGLKPGTEYAYRFGSKSPEHSAISREYHFTTPKTVTGLAVNVGQTFLSAAELMARVTGTPIPAPAPYAAAQAPYVPPKPTPVATPEPEPEPEPTSTPEPAPAPNSSLFGKVKSLFGF